MAKNWIPLRQVEGTASRQAHVRLPEGTYEREISKEGFFGPSAQFHCLPARESPAGTIPFWDNPNLGLVNSPACGSGVHGCDRSTPMAIRPLSRSW